MTQRLEIVAFLAILATCALWIGVAAWVNSILWEVRSRLKHTQKGLETLIRELERC